MSEKEQLPITLTELISTICNRINAAVNMYDTIITLNTCNSCNKNNSCEYVPEEGETVRLNCPLWEEIKEEENCEACKIDVDNPLEGQMSIEDIKK